MRRSRENGFELALDSCFSFVLAVDDTTLPHCVFSHVWKGESGGRNERGMVINGMVEVIPS